MNEVCIVTMQRRLRHLELETTRNILKENIPETYQKKKKKILSMVKQVKYCIFKLQISGPCSNFLEGKGGPGGLKHIGFLPCQTNSSKENQSE